MMSFLIIVFVSTLSLIILFYPFYIEFNTETKIVTITFLNYFSLEFDPSFYRKKNSFKKITFFNLKKKQLFLILKSFKIIYLKIDVDTGNYPLNGIIYPFLFLASFIFNKKINVNFLGRNSLQIILKNNLARLSWAYFSSK